MLLQPSKAYLITCAATGYVSFNTSVTVSAGSQITNLDFGLDASPAAGITSGVYGHVTNGLAAVPGTYVQLLDPANDYAPLGSPLAVDEVGEVELLPVVPPTLLRHDRARVGVAGEPVEGHAAASHWVLTPTPYRVY